MIGVPIQRMLVPALSSEWGTYVSGAVSIFLSALIVGYIFAGKIWEEAWMKTIAKITVLAATLMIFYVISFPALPHWGPTVKDAYEATYPEAATWTPSEWLTAEQNTLAQVMLIDVAMVLILGFIGLYVGSMLRRPSRK